MPGASARTGAGCALRQAGRGRAEVAERSGEQPGDVHLGDAELLADLRLCHVTVTAHQQDFLLTVGQLAPVRGDGRMPGMCSTCGSSWPRRSPRVAAPRWPP